MSQTPSAGCRCAHTAQRGVLYCSELAQRGTSTAATLQILKEALTNDNNNPTLLKLWFKGSTLKLLPGLADCEKIKWITLPLWVILRLSRNIQYTVQQQQMHFWCTIISIEILHSGTKISTVISNLRLCFVFVCWITSAHYSQVLI